MVISTKENKLPSSQPSPPSPSSPSSPPSHDSKFIAVHVKVKDMEHFNDNLPPCPTGALISTKHDHDEEEDTEDLMQQVS